MFATYYNTIFPLAGGKEAFFQKLINFFKPTSALDLGCATGELTGFLNNHGCKTTGIDLSQDLLNLAQGQPGEFVLADMVEFLQTQPPQPKDLVICIGNTLPHLNASDLEVFIRAVPKWLKDDGILVIQTVNYHKILKYKEPGLPTIERPKEGVKFSRLYSYNPDGSIAFTAVLDGPEGRDRSTVTLWPYTAEELKARLSESFTVIGEYGGFTESPYEREESNAWVLVTRVR